MMRIDSGNRGKTSTATMGCLMAMAVAVLASGAMADRTIDQIRVSADGGASFSSQVTVQPGADVVVEVTVTTDANGTGPAWESAVVDFDPDGEAFILFDDPAVSTATQTVDTFTLPAPVIEGTYAARATAYEADGATGDKSNTFVLADAVIVDSGKDMVFSDDFYRVDRNQNLADLGNNWVEVEDNEFQVMIPSKTDAARFFYYLGVSATELSMTQEIALGTKSNVDVYFKYRTNGTEVDDSIIVQWAVAGSGSFQNALTIPLGNNPSYFTEVGKATLPAAAGGKTIDLRIIGVMNNTNDQIFIGDVAVYANDVTATDNDNDTYFTPADCNDNDDTIYPGAPETPDDGIDQDCNGADTVTCYADGDDDGYGAGPAILNANGSCPAGQVDNDTDCDDGDDTIYPGATEVPNDGIDQDCDGSDLTTGMTCPADADGDSYGDATATVTSTDADCDDPGEADNTDDCDDSDDTIYPGAPEIVDDGIDQDCNGADEVSCYTDGDDDGYGAGTAVGTAPSGTCPAGQADNDTDCDDGDDTIHPGATEVPNDGIDQDCNGSDATGITCPADADGDNYGDATATVISTDADCDDPGEADNTDDCDDSDDTIYPGAPEIVDDGIDQDCNGADEVSCYTDGDNDGYGAGAAVGTAPSGTCPGGQADNDTDCDDADAAVHPGATEVCGNGKDDDCSGGDASCGGGGGGSGQPSTPDADGDGVPDDEDVCPTGDDTVDTDGDGVPDACDICADGDDLQDADGDGVPDACDICLTGDDSADADLDGVPDACDVCPNGDDTQDADGDGVPDLCDQCAAGDDNVDTDGDGVADACDICAAGDDAADADGDGVPDACDQCPAADDKADADGDGVADGCDICAAGDDAVDTDNDGTPDACDETPNGGNQPAEPGDGDGDSDGDEGPVNCFPVTATPLMGMALGLFLMRRRRW